jgi:hypothetical protein
MLNAAIPAAEFFNTERREVFMAFLPRHTSPCAYDALPLSI